MWQVLTKLFTLCEVYGPVLLTDQSSFGFRLWKECAYEAHGQPKIKGLDVCLAYTLVMRCISETWDTLLFNRLTSPSTLLVLSQHRLCLQRSSSRKAEHDSAVVLALKSLTMMGVQAMEIGHPKITKCVFQFPFWTTFISYAVSMILITSVELFSSSQEQEHGIRVMKDYLYSLNKRWKIAGIWPSL